MIPEHRPTRLPVFLASVISKLYSIGINHQNRKYDRGINVTSLDRRVISIGNLSTGGTGKTPLVQYVVRALVEAGHRPVIAMRGYKAQRGQMSDEQREHADALPGVPIVAQADRIAGLLRLFAKGHGEQIDCVVLDDGFQHRKIERDLDVVLIDATRPPNHDALLPLGFLREPIDSLKRADVVVVTHAEQFDQKKLDELVHWIGTVSHPDMPVVVTEHKWQRVRLYECSPNHEQCLSLADVAGMKVTAISGIGNPDAFVQMAELAKMQVVHRLDLPDHAHISDSQWVRFVERAEGVGAEWILMTQKDWVKIEPRFERLQEAMKLPVLVPELGVVFRSGESIFVDRVLAQE